MRACSVLDLRNIRLTDGLAALFANGADQFLLGHGAAEAAQRTFDFPQVTDFLAQFHISYRDIYIAICNICQEMDST